MSVCKYCAGIVGWHETWCTRPLPEPIQTGINMDEPNEDLTTSDPEGHPVTAPDLSAIRAQLAAITPDWVCDGFADGAIVNLSIYEGTNQGQIIAGDITRQANAAFIAAAPSTVTRLLGIVERVEDLATYLETLAEGDRHYAGLIRAAITREGGA